MFVFPNAYKRGKSWSSSGRQGRGVQPELCTNFQKRLEGWEYAWPVVAVRIPGLRPMNMQIRLGASESVRWLVKWAYFDGGA